MYDMKNMNLLEWIITILCLIVFSVCISYCMQRAYVTKHLILDIQEMQKLQSQDERIRTSGLLAPSQTLLPD